MEMEGFRTQTAYGAEMALQAVERATFDLALIDINMPGMDRASRCAAGCWPCPLVCGC